MDLVPRAKALLYRLQALKESMGVSTYSMFERVSDDAFIECLSANGIEIITITVAPEVVGVPAPEFESTSFAYPTFFSGLIYPGTLEVDPASKPDAEGNVPDRLKLFAPTANTRKFTKLPAGYQYINRLAIKPNQDFPELKEPDGAFYRNSQYALLKPSMYSGLMAAAVQVTMGMGKLPMPMFNLLQKQSPAYAKLVKSLGVQIRWDYKFNTTHGITVGADGTKWLVEISRANGVRAMKLPIYEMSDKEFYLLRAINAGDEAMRRALLLLECLPTGEGFPTKADDRVYQLMSAGELSDFYSHQTYSTSMGWCFSPDGSQAHNTCWDVADDGYLTGWHYRLQLNFPKPGVDGKYQPTATLVPVSSGRLYAPAARLGRYLYIKFYEPALGYLVSFDASPARDHVGPPPECDTTMFVMYNQNDLIEVKFQRKNAQSISEHNDPRGPDDCLFNNSWTITDKQGSTNVGPAFYTSDYDDRQTYSDTVTVTNIKSVDMGYDPPAFTDFIEDPEYCIMWRVKGFQVTTDTDVSGGESSAAVIAIPAFCREAYYYAYGHFYRSHTKTHAINWDFLRDPYQYYGWRKFVRIGPSPVPSYCDASACGTAHTQRLIICEEFAPYPCSDYADSGSWATQCQDILSTCSYPPRIHPTSYVSTDMGIDPTQHLNLVANTGMTPFQIPGFTWNNFNHWLIPSPDPDSGLTQYIGATYSAVGEFGLIYDTDLVGYGTLATQGTTCVTPPGGLATYVGSNAP